MKRYVPLQRLTLYLLILPLLPLIFYLPTHYFSSLRQLQRMECDVEKVKEMTYLKEQKQEINEVVRQIFSSASPTFVNDELESLNLLNREKEAIETIIKMPSFPGNDTLERRYSFITTENKMKFLEGASIKKEAIEEILLTLSHPIEGDGSDLKEILKVIEERKKESPQLLFTSFKLNKKTMHNKGEVYEINIQLLRREYLQ